MLILSTSKVIDTENRFSYNPGFNDVEEPGEFDSEVVTAPAEYQTISREFQPRVREVTRLRDTYRGEN